jgi:hypothetical protein
MPKVFIFGIKTGNKLWKTRNLLTAKSPSKTLRTEDRKGEQSRW